MSIENSAQLKMEAFIDKLAFWCKLHPTKCKKRSGSCTSIHQCSKPLGDCLSLSLSSSIKIYRLLLVETKEYYENIKKTCDLPGASTIKTWYLQWNNDNISINTDKEPFKEIMLFLNHFSKNPEIVDIVLAKHISTLKEYYDTSQFEAGRKLANELIKIYPFQNIIIRYWALLHSRSNNRGLIRSVLLEKISKTKVEYIKAECRLAIFESYLNEFTKEANISSFNELKKQKEIQLDLISEEEKKGKYYYNLGRYYEAEWFVLPLEEKKSKQTPLLRAIASISNSIEIYILNRQDNSSDSYNYDAPWWLYCHLAILYKITSDSRFEEVFKIFETKILDIFEKKPLKKSIQAYLLTYYVLLNDLTLFNNGCNYMNKVITAFLVGKPKSSIKEISEAEEFTFHHIDFIYYNNIKKKKVYSELLTLWLKQESKR